MKTKGSRSRKAPRRDPSLMEREDLRLPDLALDVLKQYLRTSLTPLADEMLKLLKSRQYERLVKVEINPSHYLDADMFRRDYLAVNMLSKYKGFVLNVDRVAVALEAFQESEARCRRVNLDLREIIQGRNEYSLTSAVLFMARRKIHDLLGDFDWNECAQHFAWGPGASTSKSRKRADVYYKFGSETHATPNFAPLVEPILKWFAPWAPKVITVPGSKGTTVPKNAQKDRFIAIEPDLNLFVQKGIGKMIRSRLQKVGLLRRTAQMINALLAEIGSRDGSLATIDLKGASDAIALALVEYLLPEDWVEAIKLCRSPFCVLPSGQKVYLEKVSSMGNGFTFELETLIFWALARSFVSLVEDKERRVQVYGDDIVMSSAAAPAFQEVLLILGFVTNKDKTFCDGPFRESCGKHYFAGTDVTPFYIKDPVDTVPRYYWLANSIALWARDPVLAVLDSRWFHLYNRIVQALPLWCRFLRIPLSAGSDTGLFTNLDSAMSFEVSFCRRYQRGWLYPSLRPKATYRDVKGVIPRILKMLYILERRGVTGYEEQDSAWKLLPPALVREFAVNFPDSTTIRGGITSDAGLWQVATGRRRSWTPEWFDLGSWIA